MNKPHASSADHTPSAASREHDAAGEGFAPYPARSGDHHAIHQLLHEVFGGPSLREFQAEQEQPGYTPASRHLIRDGKKIIGHIRLVPGTMHLACGELPIARVCDFAVQNKYRQRGLGKALLHAAEQQATALGVALVMARSDKAQYFGREGWFPCGQHIYSLAGPREILAELDRRLHAKTPTISLPRKPAAEVTVRRWKQTEHAAIQRLYREGIAEIPGPLVRSDTQWRWLIGREAYDWLYLAIEGPDQTTFDEVQAHIIGYMFMKGSRVVEMMTAPKREDAARALLMRACHDAIEQDISPLRLDAPVEHPIHALFAAAGGQLIHRECEGQQWRLAKVLDWPRFLLAALPHTKAQPLTVECTNSQQAKYLLTQEQGKTHFELHTGNHAVPQLACSSITLAQLLLGHYTLEESLTRGLLQFHHPAAATSFAERLPTRSLWLSPLEEMLAE